MKLLQHLIQLLLHKKEKNNDRAMIDNNHGPIYISGGNKMLEEIKLLRDEVDNKILDLKTINTDSLINERLEAEKERIIQEVKNEIDEKITKYETELEHYDFVIKVLEEKETQKNEEQPSSNYEDSTSLNI